MIAINSPLIITSEFPHIHSLLNFNKTRNLRFKKQLLCMALFLYQKLSLLYSSIFWPTNRFLLIHSIIPFSFSWKHFTMHLLDRLYHVLNLPVHNPQNHYIIVPEIYWVQHFIVDVFFSLRNTINSGVFFCHICPVSFLNHFYHMVLCIFLNNFKTLIGINCSLSIDNLHVFRKSLDRFLNSFFILDLYIFSETKPVWNAIDSCPASVA